MATEGGKVEVVTGVLFLALKSMQTVIAAMKSEGDCCLAGMLRQTWTVCGKAETLLCYKSLDSKAMISPGVMYSCESWAVKKAERQRIDTFELWC